MEYFYPRTCLQPNMLAPGPKRVRLISTYLAFQTAVMCTGADPEKKLTVDNLKF